MRSAKAGVFSVTGSSRVTFLWRAGGQHSVQLGHREVLADAPAGTEPEGEKRKMPSP